MSELPDPLTPPDCDLRGNDWMPLHGARLYSSFFDAHATDAEWRAGHKLWWAAWTQVPAASLPDDDVVLCRDAGFGRDMKAWNKVKKMALWGFIKCNDGRLYHRFLADEAIVSFALRLKSDKKREEDRERLRKWRATRDATKNDAGRNVGGNAGEAPDETQRETRFVGGRQDKTGQDKEDSVLRTGADAPIETPRKKLFDDGVPIVARLASMPAGSARTFVAKQLKAMHDDCPGMLAVLVEAEQMQPGDPLAWIAAAVLTRSGERLTPFQARKARSADLMRRAMAGELDQPEPMGLLA